MRGTVGKTREGKEGKVRFRQEAKRCKVSQWKAVRDRERQR